MTVPTFSSPLNRRDFVRAAAASACGIALTPRGSAGLAPKKPVVIGGLFPGGPYSPLTRSLARGFRLGTDEGLRASALFSQPLEPLRITYRDPADIETQVLRMKSLGAHVVIGGESEDDCRMIGSACSAAGIVYLNPASRANALRRDSCSHFVYHVEASDAMYRAAMSASRGHEIMLWHPALTRYGASQLNDRYRAQFGEPMSGSAWAAWFAFKLAWEAGLRTSGAGAGAIAAALSSDNTEFDGHKGAPLTFRAWDHQLRQPLYAVATSAGKAIVTDVPDLAKSSRPARDLLDTLGDGASSRACAAGGQ